MRAPLILSRAQLATSRSQQSLRANANTFGASLGQGIGEVGQALQKRGLEMIEEDRRENIQNAVNAVISETSILLNGDGDRKVGFNQLEKRDAEQQLGDYLGDFDSIIQRNGQALTARERARFDERLSSYQHDVRNKFAAHAVTQRRLAIDESYLVELANIREEAKEAYSDAGKFAQHIDRLRSTVSAHNSSSDEDVIEHLAKAQTSAAVRAAIENALSNEDEIAASMLLSDYGDALIGEDKTVSERVEGFRRDRIVRDHSTEIIRQYDDSDLPLSQRYQNALDMISIEVDEDYRADVKREVDLHNNRYVAIAQQQRIEYADRRYAVTQSGKTYSELTAQERTLFSPAELERARSLEENQAKIEKRTKLREESAASFAQTVEDTAAEYPHTTRDSWVFGEVLEAYLDNFVTEESTIEEVDAWLSLTAKTLNEPVGFYSPKVNRNGSIISLTDGGLIPDNAPSTVFDLLSRFSEPDSMFGDPVLKEHLPLIEDFIRQIGVVDPIALTRSYHSAMLALDARSLFAESLETEDIYQLLSEFYEANTKSDELGLFVFIGEDTSR